MDLTRFNFENRLHIAKTLQQLNDLTEEGMNYLEFININTLYHWDREWRMRYLSITGISRLISPFKEPIS